MINADNKLRYTMQRLCRDGGAMIGSVFTLMQTVGVGLPGCRYLVG